MAVRLTPYLSFRSNAREAMEFYASVFGGRLDVLSFADYGGMGVPDDQTHWVMHSALVVSDGVTLMGSDSPTSTGEPAANSTVALSGEDEALLRGWWDGLAVGAEITVALENAPWGDAFGQLIDKFGVPWMFNIAVGED